MGRGAPLRAIQSLPRSLVSARRYTYASNIYVAQKLIASGNIINNNNNYYYYYYIGLTHYWGLYVIHFKVKK